LIVVDMQRHAIFAVDSWPVTPFHTIYATYAMHVIARFVRDDVETHGPRETPFTYETFDPTTWPHIIPAHVPTQDNGSDCGVFMLETIRRWMWHTTTQCIAQHNKALQTKSTKETTFCSSSFSASNSSRSNISFLFTESLNSTSLSTLASSAASSCSTTSSSSSSSLRAPVSPYPTLSFGPRDIPAIRLRIVWELRHQQGLAPHSSSSKS